VLHRTGIQLCSIAASELGCSLALRLRYASKEKPVPPLEQSQRMNELVIDINKVLLGNGVQEQITLSDITITDKMIS